MGHKPAGDHIVEKLRSGILIDPFRVISRLKLLMQL
jgi:hypothetical protein